MMNDHQTALCSLLLGSFPSFSSGDAEAALAAYEMVMSQADERDLQPGFMLLINGLYPGHDGRFAPTAPQLATAIRMARDKRLEHERIERIAQPRLPAPDVVHPPESQARVRDLMKHTVDRIGAVDAHIGAESIAAAKARWEKTNARFRPPMDADSVSRRLLGYSTEANAEDAA